MAYLGVRKRAGELCVLSLVICLGVPANARAEGIDLLDARSLWKKQYVFIPPRISEQAARAAGRPAGPASRAEALSKAVIWVGNKYRRVLSGLNTIPLPGEWRAVGFDDYDWHSATGGNLAQGDPRISRTYDPRYVRGTDPFVPEIGLIAQRGRFVVKDPSKVKTLTLNITYRGGFVAFLNGKRVASGSLPAGEVAHDTPADDYPLDAFVIKSADGPMTPLSWSKHRGNAFLPQWAQRERQCGPIELDRGDLVRGVNVLALELHRSDYPLECTKKQVGLGFSSVGLAEFSLKADTDAGNVVSACVKPAALRVWNANTWQPVTTADWGNPAEALRPVRIAGARNGVFAGQVVVSSPNPIEGLTVRRSGLKSPKGEIKADAVRCLYGALNPLYESNRFDLLLEAPPSHGEVVLPIWIAVRVPQDAPAGVFEGTIDISARGVSTVAVPIELSVSDWAVPDVEDYTPPTVIYQSPESLARQHKVEMWSEGHWALVERSLKLMGEFGNSGLLFPLLAESCMGNPRSMITWMEQEDGTYEHDFSVFDRYLDLAMKYHSPKRIRLMAINVWGYENAVRKTGPAAFGSKITVKDSSGRTTNVKLPECGTPECEAMWKPLLLAVQQRLKKHSVGQKMMYGLGGDRMPSPKQAAMFNRILPGTPWFRESHFALESIRYDATDRSKTVPVGVTSMVWGESIPSPADKRLYGWKCNPKNIRLNFKRNLKGFRQPWDFRMWMEGTLASGRNGNSRVGGDFYNFGIRVKDIWSPEVLKTKSYDQKRAPRCLFNTFPDSNVAQTALGQSTTDLFGPGEDGPVTTVRFENARLGNQEAEARIAVEKAILEGRLSPALAKRCQRFLDNRTNALRLWFTPGRALGNAGWRASNRELFDLAGEAARTVK